MQLREHLFKLNFLYIHSSYVAEKILNIEKKNNKTKLKLKLFIGHLYFKSRVIIFNKEKSRKLKRSESVAYFLLINRFVNR